MNSIKQAILNTILTNLDDKIDALKQSIISAKESRDNETKSSVGDKYETSRTLMQTEVEKNRVQLNKTELLKAELSKIDIHKSFDQVEFGSLVKTNQINYFISAALGKIELAGEIYFCISLASPIGKLLHTKRVGNTFVFNGKVDTIVEIS